MDEFPDGFEWDPNKAQTNLATHGVSFEDAATVFGGGGLWAHRDVAHLGWEERFVVVGLSAVGRLLVVAYTYRGDRIRLISARPASKRDQQRHDQAKRRFIPLP